MMHEPVIKPSHKDGVDSATPSNSTNNAQRDCWRDARATLRSQRTRFAKATQVERLPSLRSTSRRIRGGFVKASHNKSRKVIPRKGLLIVYTGNGKGKTTAAFGLALRALGHGERVCIVQFIKGAWKCGEVASIARFRKLLTCRVMGLGFTWESRDRDRDIRAARRAWRCACKALASHRYGLVILDELTYLARYGIVPIREIVNALRRRAPGLHVVVTGRGAPRSLVAAADLVTEMRAIKHPYDRGIKAQPGIEF